jgi:hypothetical protein
VRVDLLLTDRPITPSGTGRAAPHLLTRSFDRRAADAVVHLLDLKSGRGSGAPEITKDQPLGGGPSRELNYIIGGMGQLKCDERLRLALFCQSAQARMNAQR